MAERQGTKSGEALLRAIRGARLTSVQFVLDYLILGFDEKGAVTTLVWPEVLKDEITFAFGIPGYRDELCALIAQVVDDVRIFDEDTIVIYFQNKSQIRIPLRTYKGSGERAIFTAPNHVLLTW